MTAQLAAPLVHAGAAPDRARLGLVLVHGRGGTASDILSLGTALGLPDIALVAPEAPGQSWWPTSFLAPQALMEPHVQSGLAAIEDAIATLEAAGLARARIALAGFSQGGCLALEYAARRGGLRSVFGLSAGLVGTADAGEPARARLHGHSPKRFDYTADLGAMSAFIAVHEQDPHIPLSRARHSAAVLTRLGSATDFRIAPGPGHAITADSVAALRAAMRP